MGRSSTDLTSHVDEPEQASSEQTRAGIVTAERVIYPVTKDSLYLGFSDSSTKSTVIRPRLWDSIYNFQIELLVVEQATDKAETDEGPSWLTTWLMGIKFN